MEQKELFGSALVWQPSAFAVEIYATGVAAILPAKVFGNATN
jgi:hypothetical protein